MTYQDFINEYLKLHNKGKNLPLGEETPYKKSFKSSRKFMLFSPHPDDEIITGALALRLQQELNFHIINIAVTLGSNIQNKNIRKNEVLKACNSIGFDCIIPQKNALDNINLLSRDNKPEWHKKVNIISNLILEYKPEIISIPHQNDFNSTHVGVHFLIMDSLQQLEQQHAYTPLVIETEFWHQMTSPNLLIEVSATDEALLMQALACHKNELQRMPYHLMHPVRMQDNVLRGSEVIGGQGTQIQNMNFAMIYRLSKYQNMQLNPQQKQIFSQTDPLENLFID